MTIYRKTEAPKLSASSPPVSSLRLPVTRFCAASPGIDAHKSAKIGLMFTQLLTVREAADRLKLQPTTLWRMIWRRELPIVRPTGRRAVRIREADLEALIFAGIQGASGSTPDPRSASTS